MDELTFFNRHYITVDGQSRITDGWSNGPHPERDTTGAICINEQGGYQFRLFQGGEENPQLFDADGILLYKYVDGMVRERIPEEIEADRARIPPPLPSEMEQLRADLDFVMVMTDLM